jgi:hypothetical protein
MLLPWTRVSAYDLALEIRDHDDGELRGRPALESILLKTSLPFLFDAYMAVCAIDVRSVD